ncbi:uncharacterized protein LOC126840818 [Adelges cooleyi]|uniref:uncharacterized protein LOC126840818 n=1 Tax=Adelges cooleyi TaxID=133065 RepID=UPI0021808BAB|nr:uncharacterized protein LOC126840818 [Adelges cooleyi]
MLPWVFLTCALVQGLHGLSVHLPEDTVPVSYDLTIAPDFDRGNGTFAGTVDIVILVKSFTSVIVLNSKDLDITSIQVTDRDDRQEIKVNDWIYLVNPQEQIRIKTNTTLEAENKYKLSVKFNGYLRNDMTGFYKSSYLINSTRQWVAATQFKATYARSAFPCYDDPRFKTPFNVTVGIKGNQIALCNMPEWYKSYDDEYTWVHFQTTPPLSSYLVAFVVGDFSHLPTNAANVKVYAHPEFVDQTKYASVAAPLLLEAMENYTGVQFGTPKIDLIAIPNVQFKETGGGFGLNIYQESSALVDEASNTQAIVSATKVMQHQISHQWFSGMVTPNTWEDLWINEGFPTFFSYFVAAKVEPNWCLDGFFVVYQHQPALEYDQVPRDSMSRTVSTPEEINGIPWRLSHSKSSAVLRMLHDYIGENVFKNALFHYISKYKYQVVSQHDLWNAFESALAGANQSLFEDEPLHVVMDSWTEQCGYPVINVVQNENSFVVTQERFLIQPLGTSDIASFECRIKTGKWYIGLTHTTDKSQNFLNLNPTTWLKPSMNRTVIPAPDYYKWFIFNLQSSGFYRVNYDKPNWMALIKQLNSSPEAVHVLNRAQLIDDAFNLARAGKLSYSVPVKLSTYLGNEDDVMPWYSAMNCFTFILERMRPSTGYNRIKAYVSNLAETIYKKVESLVTVKKNKKQSVYVSWNIFSVWACKLDNAYCKQSVLKYFQLWLSGKSIPADIKDAAFCIGLQNSNTSENWEKLLNLYKTTKSAAERQSALMSLACTEDSDLLKKFLNFIFDDQEPIRPQDFKMVFTSVATTPRGLNILIDFLRENVNKIYNEMPDGLNIAKDILSILASKVAMKEEIDKVGELRVSITESYLLKTIFRSLCDYIVDNQNWYDRYSESINKKSNQSLPGFATKMMISYTQSLFFIWAANSFLLGNAGPFGAMDVYRLPDHTKPESYALRMTPMVDPDNNRFSFSGQVEIVIAVKLYTYTVVLNSDDLDVSDVSEFQDLKSQRFVPVKSFASVQRNQQLVITLQTALLAKRRYRFTVKFSGILRNDFTGFHRESYNTKDNARWIAVTRFKPAHTRRAFPCYDEPIFKSTFAISIARQPGHLALSNMPLDLSQFDNDTGLIWDHFEVTKPMPTHMVAFMVSDFEKSVNGMITMYARKEIISHTGYMVDKAPELLRFMEDYTRIPYMLPKLDMVSVPKTNIDNVENWGLNSYGELHTSLSNDSQTEDKLLGTMVLQREISRQWFGNLVTCSWWDYAWLNEGIGHYMKYYATSMIEPEWELEGMFVSKVHQRALAWDEYADSHKLTVAVQDPEQIEDVFDCLSYNKGAALFRMLKHTVGDDQFRASLIDYLDSYSYGVAAPHDLWSSFDNVRFDSGNDSGNDVTVNDTMYLWSEQAGYPLITVVSSNNSVVISQKRFYASDPEEVDDTKWFVGLTFTTEKDQRFDQLAPTVWLKPTQENAVIPLHSDSGWMIFNLQSTGYYRVNYDENNWKLLLIQLMTDPEKIHPLNRAQIIDDAHHLARANIIPYTYYFSLLEYLMMEDHVVPWNSAVNGLESTMNAMRSFPNEYKKLNSYAINLSGIAFKKLDTRKNINQIDDNSNKFGWHVLSAWACKLGNQVCVESALKYFNAWENGHDIPSEMKEASFCVGIRKGNEFTWTKLLEFYKKSQSVFDKNAVLRALSCTENERLLLKYIGFVLMKPREIHDHETALKSLVSTGRGVGVLLECFYRLFKTIIESDISRQIAVSAYSALASKVVLSNEVHWMDKIRRSAPADMRALYDQEYSKIQTNLAWSGRDGEKIDKALGGRPNIILY